MTVNDSVMLNSEKITFALRELFIAGGFKRYRMSKFEEYDLYAKNKEFLISDNVITFTDSAGRLMALKPDVTLSIIKNSKDNPDELQKVYYNENVYRFSKEEGSFKEIMQVGAECIGKVNTNVVSDIIELALKSLEQFDKHCILALSDLDIVKELVCLATASESGRRALYNAVAFKNRKAVTDTASGVYSEALKNLIGLHGGICTVLPRLKKVLSPIEEKQCCKDFIALLEKLCKTSGAGKIFIDFSVTDDMNYYNGTVFKGFVDGISDVVLSGGRYDNLMKKMGFASMAVGFAAYTDKSDGVRTDEKQGGGYLNVAVPKGRLGEKVFGLFTKSGISTPDMNDDNRKLIFENNEHKIRFFWVKPADVAKYVEKGAADIGIAGRDILLETEPEIYELADLGIGKCRMAAAALRGYRDDTSRALRVATKFENIARKYYRTGGRDIEIIKLNGSIEVAPVLGLSDVIVDIVETGTTLKENNLEVIDEIAPVSARIIANRASYKFKNEKIEDTVNRLVSALGE